MRKALIVGINNYPNSPLTGCITDATKVGQLLESNGDGSPNFDINMQHDVKTKRELTQLIRELFSGDSDISLLYFSGHGTPDGGGCLVTPDATGEGDMGVSLTEVLRLANKSKSKNKIIILDCCFSGKLGENGLTGTNESVISPGVTIMTASTSEQVAMEGALSSGGIFTNLFVEGLKGSAADIGGNITPASLYSFVDQSLGAWEQRPVFKTNITKFLPVRTVEPKVPLTTLRKLSQYFQNPSDEFGLDPSFEFTNDPLVEHKYEEPYASQENINKFKELQSLESVGLIEPVGTEHMYFAAMESRSCKLTALGLHYWRLAKDKRF
ncbi:caspase family protein [Enterococcus sp. AZ101]|uniref:caspase family protein n=1 Tax=Enterococcus sp. AZ101 TaxID=2774742 RepID=UPI003D2A40F3